MTYLIIGLGKSGYFAAKYLLKRQQKVFLFDDNEKKYQDLQIKELLEKNAKIFDKKTDLHLIQKAIISPGIKNSHNLIKQLTSLKIDVISEVEFGLALLKNKKVAITGTNGKSTVASLITHVLNFMKIPSICVGNIGYPITKYLNHVDDKQVLIIELSSFQLEKIKNIKFLMGLILNIYPHHLDYHKSFDSYVKAKISLSNLTGKLFVSKMVSKNFKEKLKDYITFDDINWESDNFLKQNLDAAFSICKQFQIDEKKFNLAVKSFKGLQHRIEKIATINSVSYYNDSKATNPFAVVEALNKFNQKVILIAGGFDNLNDFKLWRKSFINKVKTVIAIGNTKDKIYQTLNDIIDVVKAENLQEGFERAISIKSQNDIVLFSPGCQSFDQFQNFEARGEAFKLLVMAQKVRER